MGRKPGSKNKSKDESPAEAGHNSSAIELTEAEKQALLLNSIHEIETLTEEKDSVVAKIRSARKKLVANGFKPFEIDYALRLRKSEDDEEIERRRREAIIARFLNHPVGTQSDIFDEIDRTPAVDAAYAAGKAAGAEGKTAQSPHSPGTEQDQSWLKGWHDGQAALHSGFKKLEEAEADGELEAA